MQLLVVFLLLYYLYPRPEVGHWLKPKYCSLDKRLLTKRKIFPHNNRMLWIVRKIFRIAGNFYWKIFGGFFLSLLWYFVGAVLLFSVIGFPLSVECFRIGWLNYKPFGKSVALIFDRPIISLLWLATFGWAIGVISIINALVSCLTVVGLPLVGQWVKVCRLAFFPFCSVWK